jgi:hypothetical protein
MTKIQTIKLSNFKSITDLQADFKGCTAIVTGGNNKGKTSFLRGITDRIRFIRPEVMVKQGEKEGRGEMTLTNGDKFIWEFDNEGKDKLTYLTSEARRSVTKDLGRQFFPPVFDIDKFLQSSPKDQVKQLQVIVGLDFTEIDERYRKAYDIRTERNREAELYHVKLEKMIKVPFVAPVDLSELIGKKDAEKTRLNNLYLENKKKNQETRAKWENAKAEIDRDCKAHNDQEAKKKNVFNECFQAVTLLKCSGYLGNELDAFIESLREGLKPEMVAADLYPPEPTYIEEMPDRKILDEIDAQIVNASEINAETKKYQEYIDHKKATEQARDAAEQADDVVRSIEAERKRMIESVAFPEGITITPTGIEVDGLPLDRNQISTSKLYTAALRIASMGLGEVKTLYFDASFLDKISLAQIEEWAHEHDLQLLIERPDFDGGDIKYELIETIHEPK